MKITCTLSEYTKMARQCGETKAWFNCRNCPLNGLLELEEGEKCDIERFVRSVIMPESQLAREVAKVNGISMPASEAPEGSLELEPIKANGIMSLDVVTRRVRSERLESR